MQEQKINNFNCFKNGKKEKENQPDYYISTKIGNDYETIGSGWVKADSGGNKFISFKLSEAYQDKPGFHIVMDGTKETVDEDIL